MVHLTAEYWPFARTGGLGEAVSGLASFQAAAGMPTTVVLPLYRQVRAVAPSLERAGPPFTVTLGGRSETAWLYRVPDAAGPRVFFIEHPEFFDRAGIYGDDAGDYPDNALRFAFFCLASLTVLPQIAPDVQVLHAHDWHTALAPVYLRTMFAGEAVHGRLGVVLSVHNAGFQGHFPPETLVGLGLPRELYTPQVFEWYGRMNILKGGLTFSDLAVTVSPTHALELRTPEGGFGLQDKFVELGERLVGILNGIDPGAWNPETDPHITAHYSSYDLAGKRRCKAALQRAYGLPPGAQTPLFGMSARLVSQKGLDIVLGADLLGATDAQFIFLGSGEHRYHAALTDLAAANPERVAVEFAFTDHLEHGLLAGADLLLMPSLYEPCGLTQMRAQRYGTIPVARLVGGLVDSIEDGATGFLFTEYAPAALEQALGRALARYRERAEWRAMARHAMAQQFSWEGSAARYLDVYRRALARRSAVG
ncbi:MAG TPA: glycogen/starch synthase [Gemmatimonadales bacterium]|nr:glycogen/starch synthase [Gemmatimonadales bacterium]